MNRLSKIWKASWAVSFLPLLLPSFSLPFLHYIGTYPDCQQHCMLSTFSNKELSCGFSPQISLTYIPHCHVGKVPFCNVFTPSYQLPRSLQMYSHFSIEDTWQPIEWRPSLVPQAFLHPVFDRLQYALNLMREGLGMRLWRPRYETIGTFWAFSNFICAIRCFNLPASGSQCSLIHANRSLSSAAVSMETVFLTKLMFAIERFTFCDWIVSFPRMFCKIQDS